MREQLVKAPRKPRSKSATCLPVGFRCNFATSGSIYAIKSLAAPTAIEAVRASAVGLPMHDAARLLDQAGIPARLSRCSTVRRAIDCASH